MSDSKELKALTKEIRRIFPDSASLRWRPHLVIRTLQARVESLELQVAQLRDDFEDSRDPDD